MIVGERFLGRSASSKRQMIYNCHFDPFGKAQGKLREKSFFDGW